VQDHRLGVGDLEFAEAGLAGAEIVFAKSTHDWASLGCSAVERDDEHVDRAVDLVEAFKCGIELSDGFFGRAALFTGL
jgi:hypothetical protein